MHKYRTSWCSLICNGVTLLALLNINVKSVILTTPNTLIKSNSLERENIPLITDKHLKILILSSKYLKKSRTNQISYMTSVNIDILYNNSIMESVRQKLPTVLLITPLVR